MRSTLVSICLILTATLSGVSQDPPVREKMTLTPNEVQTLRESLATVLNSIEKTRQDLQKKQTALNSPEGAGRQEELTQEITVLSQQLSTLERNFSEIASRVDLNQFEESKESEILAWDVQLRSLLNPLIQSMVRLTSKPREIEYLRDQIRQLNEQKVLAENGLNRLIMLSQAFQNPSSVGQTTIQEPANPVNPSLDGLGDEKTPGPVSVWKKPSQGLIKAIEEEIQSWEKRLSHIQTDLTIAQQRLDQNLADKSSFSSSLHNLFNLFFKSRGRNLIMALGAMLLFWLLAYQSFSRFQSLGFLQKFRKSFKFRLLNVFFVITSILGGIFLFLFVLFLFGDWLLLTLGILTLLGILWTSKQAIASYWSQMTLLLNVGPVREGERIILNGLPYLVRNLNFFTIFENPALDGGKLRLPISDVQPLRSKPFHPDDPWFPTRKDDWVLLSDGTHCKVTLQTPEYVRVFQLGNAFRAIPTTDFIGLSPTVLSKGFRCSTTFGMDYQDQALMTEEIPKTIQTFVHDALVKAKYLPEKFTLSVEFEEAGGSSLNLAVIGDFHGEYAREYIKIKRRLQRFCVDACNANGWNIPFPQLTLHMQAKEGKSEKDD